MGKKIAFLCFNGLPYTNDWGGAQRVHYMANYLSIKNDVTVISFQNTENPFFEKEIINYKTKTFPNLINHNWVRRYSQRKFYMLSLLKKCYKKIRSYYFILSDKLLFNEPSPGTGEIIKGLLKKYEDPIIQYINNSKFDYLIISVPQFYLASPKIINSAKENKVNVILDYRDPWNCWHDAHGISEKRERTIVSLVDKIFVTNENHKDKLVSEFQTEPNKIIIIRNGYDSEKWDNIEEEKKKNKLLTISFIGSIGFSKKLKNGYRNINVFLEAIKDFKYKNDIKIKIIGNKLNPIIEKRVQGIPNIEFIDKISQEDSFKEMINADILLSLHTANDNSSHYLMAGKIYDYYRSGSKILSINSKNSYEQRFLKENKLGYCTINSKKEILKILDLIYKDHINGLLNPEIRRDISYSRNFQNKIVEDLLI